MPGFARYYQRRKTVIVAVATLASILGWIVYTWISRNLDDRYESYYPSLAEARADGAVTRGWIPDDILPLSSHAIHELHYLSPSQEWCAFAFDPADSDSLRKNLRIATEMSAAVRNVPNPRVSRNVPNPQVSWWPMQLTGEIDEAALHEKKLTLYVAEKPGTSDSNEIFLFAIDWQGGSGFFYSSE